jgi:hypothetical protein
VQQMAAWDCTGAAPALLQVWIGLRRAVRAHNCPILRF